jgi:hypothetical protein
MWGGVGVDRKYQLSGAPAFLSGYFLRRALYFRYFFSFDFSFFQFNDLEKRVFDKGMS